MTLYHPDFSCYVISNKGSFTFNPNNINIWEKLFRKSVYKSAINLIRDLIYSIHILWDEDVISLYVISNMTHSSKYIRKYGLFHYLGNDKSISNLISDNDKAYGTLIKFDIKLILGKKECYNIG